MYLNDTSKLSLIAKPDTVNWCDGISGNTCCTKPVFQKILDFWGNDSNLANNPMSKVSSNTEKLIRTYYDAIHAYGTQVYEELDKKQTEANAILTNAATLITPVSAVAARNLQAQVSAPISTAAATGNFFQN
jgi:hypothetical protein